MTRQPTSSQSGQAETVPAGSDRPLGRVVDQLWSKLRYVNDLDLGVNIVDLGLVYDVRVTGSRVDVDMTLTSPACPYGPYLIQQVKDTLLGFGGITDVDVHTIWEPPWDPSRISEDVRLELGFDV